MSSPETTASTPSSPTEKTPATAEVAAASEDNESSTPAPKRTAQEVIDQNGNVAGKRFVITGGYGGIGAATAIALLQAGGKVIIGGRDKHKLEAFMQQLKERHGDNVNGYVLDLADLKSVQEFAKCVNGNFAHVDVLINNAGVMKCPPSVTQQGFEMQMGINVIGHFLLAKLLVEKTHRQVWVSSAGHSMVSFIFGRNGRAVFCKNQCMFQLFY